MMQSGLIILEPRTEHKFSLIWMHGLGDTSEGFADMFTSYKLVPETCKVILPTAPKRSVTCNGHSVMTSWYDIKSLRPTANFQDHLSNYNHDQLRDSVNIIT